MLQKKKNIMFTVKGKSLKLLEMDFTLVLHWMCPLTHLKICVSVKV